ncbi:hypothetical protein DBT_0130 [Dissulfuribacter thermophilus]|uniref:Uncharacterized protein n=1 Tax=Dissulfuribacter thermophilus TaxID=1156395 RepID=A0A1B9F8V0_9BACT|nr:hypothetical protein DBT_0130 [Dissulfuribacter thermophilus]
MEKSYLTLSSPQKSDMKTLLLVKKIFLDPIRQYDQHCPINGHATLLEFKLY